MIGNPRMGEIMNDISKARKHFYQEFLKEGFDYTKGYLSSFKGVRKFWNDLSLTRESNRYYGAKMALEEMIKEK